MPDGEFDADRMLERALQQVDPIPIERSRAADRKRFRFGPRKIEARIILDEVERLG
jgi:hypothetical protein